MNEARDLVAVYGGGGVPVYWIVNLVDRQVEVYTGPCADGYQSRQDVTEGNDVAAVIEGREVGRIAVSEPSCRELSETVILHRDPEVRRPRPAQRRRPGRKRNRERSKLNRPMHWRCRWALSRNIILCRASTTLLAKPRHPQGVSAQLAMWTRPAPWDVTFTSRWRQRSERIEPRT